MPNAAAHKTTAGMVMASASLLLTIDERHQVEQALASGGLAYLLGTLPDILEPATNPNHRRFFHSITFACGVGYGMYHLYEWQPEEEWKKWARFGLMVAGGATLVHLAMDSRTPKGLPMI